MASPPDPHLLVSFPPSPDPLSPPNRVRDVDIHRDSPNEQYNPMDNDAEPTHDSFQALEDILISHQPDEAPPLPGLLDEQLQLVFELRRDVVELLFGVELLNRRLDAFMDTLSGSSNNRRCPACHQPNPFIAPWCTHPDNGGNQHNPGM
jgi:hypothetical protein